MARTFRMVLEDYEPDVIVCGLPQTMAGRRAPRPRASARSRGASTRVTGLPVEFIDERLSSTEAKRILREQGLSEKQMRGKVDMISASLFLQAWLDAQSRKEDRGSRSRLPSPGRCASSRGRAPFRTPDSASAPSQRPRSAAYPSHGAPSPAQAPAPHAAGSRFAQGSHQSYAHQGSQGPTYMPQRSQGAYAREGRPPAQKSARPFRS